MSTPTYKPAEEWAIYPTKVKLLTCDGAGIAAKQSALEELITLVQLQTRASALREAAEIADSQHKATQSATRFVAIVDCHKAILSAIPTIPEELK